jgi:hypothetical protein
MKKYPSIERLNNHSGSFYVFDKLDGSNIRAEWTPKTGFNKFGSRKRLLGSDQDLLMNAQSLILDKYADDLSRIFKKNRWQKVTAFFEFYGPSSFAGQHDPSESQDVTLLDVNPLKQSILPPREFLKLFGGLDIPNVLYYGNLNQELVESVKSSTLEGMTFEGVVAKQSTRKGHLPKMVKIKSDAWLSRLKHYCGEDEKLYNQLK